jgi:hypothetical protein
MFKILYVEDVIDLSRFQQNTAIKLELTRI